MTLYMKSPSPLTLESLAPDFKVTGCVEHATSTHDQPIIMWALLPLQFVFPTIPPLTLFHAYYLPFSIKPTMPHLTQWMRPYIEYIVLLKITNAHISPMHVLEHPPIHISHIWWHWNIHQTYIVILEHPPMYIFHLYAYHLWIVFNLYTWFIYAA